LALCAPMLALPKPIEHRSELNPDQECEYERQLFSRRVPN